MIQFAIVEINSTHPYYEIIMENILEEDEMLAPLLLLIASCFDTALDDYSNSKVLARFKVKVKVGTNLMDIFSSWSPNSAE